MVFGPTALLAVVPRLVQVVDQIVQAAEGEAARQSIARQCIVRKGEYVVDGRTVQAGTGVLQFKLSKPSRHPGHAAEPYIQSQGRGLLRQLAVAGSSGIDVVGGEGAGGAACRR